LFTFASDDIIPGKQTREQAIGVLSETLHYTTLVTSKMSVFLKHKQLETTFNQFGKISLHITFNNNNNNNNNPICKAPECQKTSVALRLPHICILLPQRVA